MKNAKLQKEINSIAKLSMITGELFIEVDVKAENGLEFEEKSEAILSNLVIPEGLEISENLVFRKGGAKDTSSADASVKVRVTVDSQGLHSAFFCRESSSARQEERACHDMKWPSLQQARPLFLKEG